MRRIRHDGQTGTDREHPQVMFAAGTFAQSAEVVVMGGLEPPTCGL